ncbi:MAG: M15 family metallopeptidase [Coriobacteriales bacterium]|nr:M15 family metallopeptidase [Coriobacteriales bacterium]
MEKTITRKAFVSMAGGTLWAMLLSACGATSDQASTAKSTIDYMVLVNKQHALPDGWEESLDLVEEKSLLYDDPVQVERKAYEAYQALKKDLAAEDVFVELDSCYRSVAHQQEVMDEFTKEYGEEYAKRIVATPGYSEHHTGLALDLFLVIDDEYVCENAEMEKHPKIWEKIHAKLADHGFILRYLPQRKIFTGYSYEPWHIRYIGDVDVARQIMGEGLTFEEYLGEVQPCVAGCVVDYGESEVYEDSDIDAALGTVLDEFGTWEGCVMTRFSYAGDDACGADELAYVNELREANEPDADEFGQAIVLITDFHSPSTEQAEGTAWEPDTDYEGWTWHLGRTDADGAWQLLTWGYA